MSKMQRTKGQAGEREVLNLLKDNLGLDLSRNLQQTQDGGADCLGIPGIALEIKRAKKPELTRWWRQAVDQAFEAKSIPVLAYRLDRQQWVFVTPLELINSNFVWDCYELQYAASLTLEGFCSVMREWLPEPKTVVVLSTGREVA